MTNNLHYKKDDSFMRFLAMSFCGEVAAIQLMKVYGHEFEFDGWGAGTIEVFKDAEKKRQRTPDLICAKCGQRLEVRSKSWLKVAMSDSPGRPFDRELAPDDWVGFVKVSKRWDVAEETLDLYSPDSYVQQGEIYVIKVEELSRKRGLATKSAPKSEEEGSESYLEWPILLTSESGVIETITRADPMTGAESRIDIKTSTGNVIHLTPPPMSYPYNGLHEGSRVRKFQTLLAGVARTVSQRNLACMPQDN